MSDRAQGTDNVFKVNPDGTGVLHYVNWAPPGSIEPAWGRSGTMEAWVSATGQPDTEIYVTGDTMAPHILTDRNQTRDDRDPSWSPDETQIAFQGGSDIYTSYAPLPSAAGGPETNVTNHPALDLEPAWSPDGSKIAFVSDRDAADPDPGCSPCGREVYVMDADGSDVVRLTHRSGDDATPNWSPDGSRIAFTSTAVSPAGTVHVMDADGSNVQSITGPGAANPAWSPNGQKIVFDQQMPAGGREIFTANADGSGPVNVTNNAADDFDPDWEPVNPNGLFPRPGGATPLRVPLVSAFAPCTAPNSSHVPPLDEPSCTPPQMESTQLTMLTIGYGSGMVRQTVKVGNPATPQDEADVEIGAVASGVFTKSGGDYSGQVLLNVDMRVTDRVGGVPATTVDTSFSIPFGCIPTLSPIGGSACGLDTSVDAIVPGFIVERRKTIIAAQSVELLDAGPDGDATPPSGCPPACGTGDEQVFLTQGLFAP